MKRAPMTTALLIIIGIVFAIELLLGGSDNERVLVQLGAITPDLMQTGEYWRLAAAMFLHAGWVHVAANTWALYQLGTMYETLFGSARFALIYFVTGICASLSSVMFSHDVAVGASGAVFGILGAFIFSLLRSPQYRHERWTRTLISEILFWIAVNIIIGFSVKFIDNAAHIGGLVAGLVLGFLPHRVPPPPPRGMVIDVTPSAAAQNDPYVLRPEDPLIDDGDGPAHRR
jgi:rhomboid protease GluP